MIKSRRKTRERERARQKDVGDKTQGANNEEQLSNKVAQALA